MEVTAHERPITQSGWTGSGYTFTDPQTGAGGYIIDGGSNGGWLIWDEAKEGIKFFLEVVAGYGGEAFQYVKGSSINPV